MRLLVIVFQVIFCLFLWGAGIPAVHAQINTDSTALPDTAIKGASPQPAVSYPFPQRPGKLFYVPLPQQKTVIYRDSTGNYHSQRYLFSLPVGSPFIMNQEAFARRSRRKSKQENWRRIINEFENNRNKRQGLLDFNFSIPASRGSAFETIFGKNEVDLSVNGTANLDVGASIEKTENPQIPPDRQTQINPTFSQNLKLNIQGTIGDKLSINTNFDTEAAFDFQNRVNVLYQGYENEILQQLELGNVSMETGNSLIRGGNALFGIKSKVQLGSLKLSTVLSQQNGENNTQTITGGGEERQIGIRPVDYQYDKNFFLDFFTRQQFEQNMSDPQQLGQALQLSEVNVWVLRESSQSTQGEQQAVALVDLGVNHRSDSTFSPPDEAKDIFASSLFSQFRDPAVGVSAGDFGVDPTKFVEGYFVPLQAGKDYEINRPLGFITLKQNLSARQAVAVSFKYTDPRTGQTVSVGEESQGSGDRIYLKLIRPQTVTTTNPAWRLMMKNIYSLGVKNITQEGIDLDIKYTEQNVPSSSLPQRSTILLQDLGLDRVDQQGATTPDNKIDFSTGTLNPVDGRIIFPYLQPFGNRIANLLANTGLSPSQIDNIAFDELYNQKKANADQNPENNFYRIEGTSKGNISANYSLGFSPVRGSVKVFANGQELQEDTEYTVDYSVGSVTILDEQYLQRGQDIRIEYENNRLSNIERKTFTGVRAEYDVNDHFKLGSTYFHLKEKPVQDKIRLGNEPVNNTKIGFDANADFEVPWLTHLVDALPLLQTKTPSYLHISGEFAQLRPGVAHTNAVQDAIDAGRLHSDEEQGLSFIDDFEGVDINLSFLNVSRWSLAAAPAAVPGYGPDQNLFTDSSSPSPDNSLISKVKRSDLRSQFSWYTLPRNVTRILGNVQRTPETQQVEVTDVFPNRDVLSEDNVLSTLDVHFNPQNRGPYNYNDDLKALLNTQTERTWGGMITTLPPGQEDLSQNNIEYIQFWVQVVLPDGREPTASDIQNYNGKLYIDLGSISEDVVPNFKTNTEDGLARRPDDLQRDNFDPQLSRSYIPNPPPAPEGQFSNNKRALEDVGLDGAPDEGGIDDKNEQVLFSDFIRQMRVAYGADSPQFKKIQQDPSNDDYVYYGEDQLEGVPLPRRFYRLYGYTDGNTPSNAGDKRAITNKPDAEGLITPSIVQQNNAYFEYELDLNPATINEINTAAPGNRIIDKISGSRQQDRWYHFRIPIKEFERKFGDIQNFQNISHIRLWLSGYKKPFTLRFASFKLVGSQWRQASNVNNQQNISTPINIASINIEENSRREPIPYRLPRGAVRASNRTRQRETVANEQSIVLNAQNLGPGTLAMIKRNYPGGLNMLNYSNVRMFVHGEGFENRGDVELVMRFGTDLTNNYYEYRQPITPTDSSLVFSDRPLQQISNAERQKEARQIWLYKQNSLNILLSAFNQLKQLRDQENVDPGQRFERDNLMSGSPPGAKLVIRGNPSLDRIGEIGMGLRNPFDPAHPGRGGEPSANAEVWLNELRVSGFDNRKGLAAKGKVDLRLADFADVHLNLSNQQDGFGALDSRLGQRRISSEFGYDFNSTFNLHKFIPERYGWNIPVSFTARRSLSTPRYLPNQGDVELDDFKKAVKNRTDLTSRQKSRLIDRRLDQSRDYSQNYSVSLNNVTKDRSRNPLLQYTLDKTTLNFVYNTANQHNPQYRFIDNWNYTGSLRYNLNFTSTLLARPFDFLRRVPLLDALSGLRLGYTPASISASAGINRSYNEQQRRFQSNNQNEAISDANIPLQQTHRFTYDTNFGFTYNLTPTINTAFQSQSVFDLSRAGVRRNGTPGRADSLRFKVIPTFEVLKSLVTDTLSARRKNYQEAYTAGWQPHLSKIKPISWIDYSANYTGGYQWRNSPFNSGLGATVSNNLSLNQSLSFNISDLLQHANSLSFGAAGAATKQNVLRQIGKGVLRSFSILQSINTSFNIGTSSLQTGYAGTAPFFAQFGQGGNDFSPPFTYRTGFLEQIGPEQLIQNSKNGLLVQLPSNRNLSDDLTVGMRFLPFSNLKIDLTWNTQWQKTNTETITIDPDQSSSAIRNQTGQVQSSVWVFGSGYKNLFRDQLGIALGDITASSDTLSDATGNNDGRAVLGKQSLQNSFRGAYLSGLSGAVGRRDFAPFPLPGWRISWSGFGDLIPGLRNLIRRISLLNQYSGSYRLGYEFNANQSLLPPINIGNRVVQNRRPTYAPTTINIEKRFSPLIGLNITWNSDLHTNFHIEFSRLTSLALTNATVIENLSRGLKFSINYTLNDFKIPLFPRIRNDLDLTLNTNFIEDKETKYVLSSDLDRALDEFSTVDNANFASSFTGGQTRFNGSAIVGYKFSQTVKANFQYTFRRLIPKSTGVFSRTDQEIRFNVIVSIRSDDNQ